MPGMPKPESVCFTAGPLQLCTRQLLRATYVDEGAIVAEQQEGCGRHACLGGVHILGHALQHRQGGPVVLSLQAPACPHKTSSCPAGCIHGMRGHMPWLAALAVCRAEHSRSCCMVHTDIARRCRSSES